jgi:hypothetical protein
MGQNWGGKERGCFSCYLSWLFILIKGGRKEKKNLNEKNQNCSFKSQRPS